MSSLSSQGKYANSLLSGYSEEDLQSLNDRYYDEEEKKRQKVQKDAVVAQRKDEQDKQDKVRAEQEAKIAHDKSFTETVKRGVSSVGSSLAGFVDDVKAGVGGDKARLDKAIAGTKKTGIAIGSLGLVPAGESIGNKVSDLLTGDDEANARLEMMKKDDAEAAKWKTEAQRLMKEGKTEEASKAAKKYAIYANAAEQSSAELTAGVDQTYGKNTADYWKKSMAIGAEAGVAVGSAALDATTFGAIGAAKVGAMKIGGENAFKTGAREFGESLLKDTGKGMAKNAVLAQGEKPLLFNLGQAGAQGSANAVSEGVYNEQGVGEIAGNAVTQIGSQAVMQEIPGLLMKGMNLPKTLKGIEAGNLSKATTGGRVGQFVDEINQVADLPIKRGGTGLDDVAMKTYVKSQFPDADTTKIDALSMDETMTLYTKTRQTPNITEEQLTARTNLEAETKAQRQLELENKQTEMEDLTFKQTEAQQQLVAARKAMTSGSSDLTLKTQAKILRQAEKDVAVITKSLDKLKANSPELAPAILPPRDLAPVTKPTMVDEPGLPSRDINADIASEPVVAKGLVDEIAPKVEPKVAPVAEPVVKPAENITIIGEPTVPKKTLAQIDEEIAGLQDEALTPDGAAATKGKRTELLAEKNALIKDKGEEQLVGSITRARDKDVVLDDVLQNQETYTKILTGIKETKGEKYLLDVFDDLEERYTALPNGMESEFSDSPIAEMKRNILGLQESSTVARNYIVSEDRMPGYTKIVDKPTLENLKDFVHTEMGFVPDDATVGQIYKEARATIDPIFNKMFDKSVSYDISEQVIDHLFEVDKKNIIKAYQSGKPYTPPAAWATGKKAYFVDILNQKNLSWTTFHEGLHIYSNLMMTPAERTTFRDLISARYSETPEFKNYSDFRLKDEPNLDTGQLAEEFGAQKFSEWAVKKEGISIKGFDPKTGGLIPYGTKLGDKVSTKVEPFLQDLAKTNRPLAEGMLDTIYKGASVADEFTGKLKFMAEDVIDRVRKFLGNQDEIMKAFGDIYNGKAKGAGKTKSDFNVNILDETGQGKPSWHFDENDNIVFDGVPFNRRFVEDPAVIPEEYRKYIFLKKKVDMSEFDPGITARYKQFREAFKAQNGMDDAGIAAFETKTLSDGTDVSSDPQGFIYNNYQVTPRGFILDANAARELRNRYPDTYWGYKDDLVGKLKKMKNSGDIEDAAYVVKELEAMGMSAGDIADEMGVARGGRDAQGVAFSRTVPEVAPESEMPVFGDDALDSALGRSITGNVPDFSVGKYGTNGYMWDDASTTMRASDPYGKEGKNLVRDSFESVTKMRERLEDSHIRVKQLERANGQVSDATDMYQNIEKAGNVVKAKQSVQMDRAEMIAKDMDNTAKEMNVGRDELRSMVNEYAVAKDAIDRIRVYGKDVIKGTDADPIVLMAEYQGKVDAIEASSTFPNVERLYRAVQDFSPDELRVKFEGDLISKEQYDQLSVAYRNHVNLNRDFTADLEGGELEDIVTVPDTFYGGGGRPSVSTTGLYKLKGGDYKIGDIFTNQVSAVNHAIALAERNKIAQSIVNYFDQNADLGLGEILEGKIPDAIDKKSVITAMFAGKPVSVVIHDADLATSLNNLNMEQAGWILNMGKKINGIRGSLATEFNLPFAISNKTRDIQEVMNAMASIGDFKGEVHKVVTTDLKNNVKAIMDYQAGRDTELGSLYKQMVEDGGSQGGLALHSREHTKGSVEDLFKLIDSKPRQGVKLLVEKFDNWNNVFEDSTRLSIYKAALEGGLSRERAAWLSLEVGINFGRQGTSGNALKSLYMFSNPSIQGSARTVRSWVNKPSTLVKTSLMLGSAVVAANAWNDSVDENWRDDTRLSKFTRSGNMVLLLPNEGGQPYMVKIPIGWSLKPLKTIIDYGYDVTKGKASVTDALGATTQAMVEGYNPIGGAGGLTDVFPTQVGPIPARFLAEIAANQNFMGTPIRPKGKDNMPKSYQYYDSTNEEPMGKAYVKASRFLSDVTGGKKNTRGLIEISPEDIQYGVEQLISGAGRSIGKAVNTVTNAASGEKFNLNDMPFVEKFVGQLKPTRKTEMEMYDLLANRDDASVNQAKIKQDIKNKYDNVSQIPRSELQKLKDSGMSEDSMSTFLEEFGLNRKFKSFKSLSKLEQFRLFQEMSDDEKKDLGLQW